MNDKNGAALATTGQALSARAELALVEGDLSQLSPSERVSYYHRICESLGLNPLTRPFCYLRLNGKLVLYAQKDCTEQLRAIRGISLTLPKKETIDGVYIVTARAEGSGQRVDESTGAVSIKGLQGEALANAFMKAETKAKRRVTLSICGLGMADESEVDAIPGAARVAVESAHAETLPAPAHDAETGEVVERDGRTWATGPGGAAERHAASSLASEGRFAQRRAELEACGKHRTPQGLARAWAAVNEDQRQGLLTLDQRADLATLKDQVKLVIASNAEAASKAGQAPTPQELGDELPASYNATVTDHGERGRDSVDWSGAPEGETAR